MNVERHRLVQHVRELLVYSSSYWLDLAKYSMRKLCCTADESRGGEEEGSTICLIYRRRHSCKTALIYNYPRKIITPKSLHRNHISTNPEHSTTFFHDEKSTSPPNPRPPKASITTSTPPKAFHININSSFQKTTNHRPKPRALPPLSEPPVPRPVRTCFLYTRPYITRLRTQ